MYRSPRFRWTPCRWLPSNLGGCANLSCPREGGFQHKLNFVLEVWFMGWFLQSFCGHTPKLLNEISYWVLRLICSNHWHWENVLRLKTFTDGPSHCFRVVGCFWCFTSLRMVVMKSWQMLASALVKVWCWAIVWGCNVPWLIHGVSFGTLQSEKAAMAFRPCTNRASLRMLSTPEVAILLPLSAIRRLCGPLDTAPFQLFPRHVSTIS